MLRCSYGNDGYIKRFVNGVQVGSTISSSGDYLYTDSGGIYQPSDLMVDTYDTKGYISNLSI